MAFTEQYDVVVVGAGHAGCEAAMAAARMGLKTALITMNMDLIAQMSCNPAVGGVAKGHLVREVDALGGIMGGVADAVGIQFRLLNTSRGPAVWSPRAQCDKQAYRLKMREVLESQPNLKIKQAEVAELIVEQSSVISRQSSANRASTEVSADDRRLMTDDDERQRVLGIRLRDGRTVGAAAVIIITGTFLNGLIHCGEVKIPAGALIMISPWVLHRHLNLWNEPEAFDPSRFLADKPLAHRFAYLPFGAGPRVCVGAQFALAEAAVVLAKMVQRFEISLADDEPVLPITVITTQPDHPAPFQLRPRR